MSERTFWHVRPAMIQISLRFRTVCSDSLLGAFWITKDAMFLCAGTEDWSDCTDAQADLSLRLVRISEGMISHDEAQLFFAYSSISFDAYL